MGVESCIIGMIDQTLIRSAVPMQSDEICNVAVALGYSDIPLREKSRKAKEQVIEIV